MKELIELIELNRAADGTLTLSPDQTQRLIRFLKTAAIAMKQQSKVIKNFKQLLDREMDHGPTAGTENKTSP